MNVATPSAAQIVAKMTDREKVDLLGGDGMWKSHAIERLGIPQIVMTDGTYGVRYSHQIDRDADKNDLAGFLSIANRSTGLISEFGRSKPATCFPNGSSVACSWDSGLAYRMGKALAAECQVLGVHLLLGPGINIRRTPLAGRSYEYYAEDPIISSDVAAGLIRGLQEHGVGAVLKHFACNNSEIQRTTMDSVVETRALREVYLRGFERTIRLSDPWAVMSSYNLINGIQAAENRWLLTTVLREEWGYDGAVISDWHGIKNRPASLLAGNEIDMPESPARKEALLTAMQDGSVSRQDVDRACVHALQLVNRAKLGEQPGTVCDFDAHHRLAREIAAESIVLLKNEGNLLPLDPSAARRIAVIGKGAVAPVIQGSGCATTNPARIDIPLKEIERRVGAGIAVTYAPGYEQQNFDPANHEVAIQSTPPVSGGEASERREALIAEAVRTAADADAVILFASTEIAGDGENSDRPDLNLAPGHDELIRRVAEVNQKVIVILANPDAVLMPWLDRVPVVLETFFAGAGMGHAVADILFGHTNPSGKLTVTFPKRLEDTPAFLSYPGELSRHVYSEGIFVGYRYYDRKRVEPLFPFGFGLSYTRFAYSNLRLDKASMDGDDDLSVSVDITNTGPRAGKEICQIYVHRISPRLQHPVRELKGYAKVDLRPGETKTATIVIAHRDLKSFDLERNDWLLDGAELVVEAGASSRDIRQTATVRCPVDNTHYRAFTADMTPPVIFAHPHARAKFVSFFQERLGLDLDAAEALAANCDASFFGIHDTICWFVGNRFKRSEIEEVIRGINNDVAA